MKLIYLPLIVATLTLISCASPDGVAYSPPAPMIAGAAKAERKLVHTGSQEVEVRDLKAAVFETKTIVHAQKGFVDSATIRKDDEAHIALRVPAATVQTTLDEISKLGKETMRRVTVEDETKQYIDLEAEITNLRALRTRLRALLNQTKDVEELLKVEKELARVQTKLDALESQMRSLKNKVAYAHISLNLERKRTPGPLGAAGKAVAFGVKKLFVLN